MTSETTKSGTVEPATSGEPKRKSIGWQLVQIAALAGLLFAGMYEVDLDAKALAEKRARPALLTAVEQAARQGPSTEVDPDLERAVEAYAKVCEECASAARCEAVIRSIRVEKKLPAGRGPCKEAIFERWSSDETERGSRAP
jgi:hypothetical protein